MRFTGKLKTWTDDKGFGFITPTEAFHASSSCAIR